MNAPFNISKLSKVEFEAIARIAYSEAGLFFPPRKASLVSTRIKRRVRKLGLATFSDYIRLVQSSAGGDELRIMISSLTTNVSHFFRENHHFEYLKESILPQLIQRAKHGERIRLWSAGCSTGQEPYSIALTALDMDESLEQYDFKILATDIDLNVLEIGKTAFYPDKSAPQITQGKLRKFYSPIQHEGMAGFIFSDKVKNLVSFRRLNLIQEWPFSGGFDVIFCRNVVIYFNQTTQEKLWSRFEKKLNDNGWLFVGHSERFTETSGSNFHMVGPTIYQLRKSTTIKQKDLLQWH